jgi:hypothetical protein
VIRLLIPHRRKRQLLVVSGWLVFAWWVNRQLPESVLVAGSDLWERITDVASHGRIDHADAGLLIPLTTMGMAIGTLVLGFLLVRWAAK